MRHHYHTQKTIMRALMVIAGIAVFCVLLWLILGAFNPD
jgi:hypothetical protein